MDLIKNHRNKLQKKMNDCERQLVIDCLLTDIVILEQITGRNLEHWKSI